jgi:hypothetical protein
MLKKETILTMATALKMDVAAVTAALAAEAETDVPFTGEGVKVFTDAELLSREETLKSRHEKAGMEIQIKNLKEKTGIEFDGKNEDKFVEAFKSKTLKDANIQESDKIKEANTVIEGLRNNIANLTTEKESILKESKTAQLDSEILTWTIDKKPDHLTNKEWVTMIKLNNEIAEHDGQLIVKRDGQIVANKTDLKPLTAKDALVNYIDERKWGKTIETPPPGGRSAGDSKTSILGIGNMKQFNEHLASQGINPNGQQAQAMLAEITSANANFDFSQK